MEIIILLVWVLCAIVCYQQATKKGLSGGLWAVLGLIFGIFAIIAVFLVPAKN